MTAALANGVVVFELICGIPCESNAIKLLGRFVGGVVMVIPEESVNVALPVMGLFTAAPLPVVIAYEEEETVRT